MEASRERPAPLGRYLAGVTGDQGAMAPEGAPVLSERSTPPTVPRVGRTGMEAPAGRPGRPTR